MIVQLDGHLHKKSIFVFNCKCFDIEKGGFNDLSSRSAKENNTV
jgi:hypothetical protein